MHYQGAFVNEVIFTKPNFSGNESSSLLNPFTIDLSSRVIDSNSKKQRSRKPPRLPLFTLAAGILFKMLRQQIQEYTAIFEFKKFSDKINVYSNFFDWHIFKFTRQIILFRFP